MRLTEEHEAVRRTVHKLIDAEINPHVDRWEADKRFPAHEVFARFGALGLLGLTKPERWGGQGLDYSYAMVMAEALGRIHCGGVPMAIGVQTDMATPALARFGSDAVCGEFLAPSISGARVACLGVSEVGSGSDVASIKTVARSDGGDYVVSGGKMWTTNGAQADWMCLLANTGDDGGPHRNKTLICMPMAAKGVSVARTLEKLGMWSSDTAQVFLDEVRVPKSYRIGDEGRGFIYQMQQFNEERLWAGARVVGTLDRILEATLAYTGERVAFGKPILANQAVQFRLAELKCDIEALRALTWRTAEAHLAGEDATVLAAMVKLKAGRAMREVTDACLQYWGGAGYLWESPVARAYRDGRLTSIGGGADEVMLTIISRAMGSRQRS